MNLSVIRRMVFQGDLSVDALRYLLSSCKGECEWLDFKETIDLKLQKSKADFSKDIVAFKNVGGGYIIIGVKDKTWLPVGIDDNIKYDTKELSDLVQKVTGLTIEFNIAYHNIYLDGKDLRFGIILIRKSKKAKRRIPSVIKKDFEIKTDYGLRMGDIYARSGDSTKRVSSESELAEILDNLEEQADENEILSPSSFFAINDGLYRLLEKGFETFIGRATLRQDIIDSIVKDPRIWIINIHGPGGVGKSAIVNWVIYRFYEQKKPFEAILHLTAKETVLTTKGIESHSRSLYSLENLLDNILLLFEYPINLPFDEKKSQVIEILSAWKTLIVLDNMETVNDARILKFVQDLPPGSQAKILITSRQKTGGWELPISLKEFNKIEVEEFLQHRTKELGINLSITDEIVDKIWQATGGLPLATQWILGNYKLTGDLDSIIEHAKSADAPILEFSFRYIWSKLSPDAKTILAIMSIFDEPPSLQHIAIVSEIQIDRIQDALEELIDCTLINKERQLSDGKEVYVALPITLNFASLQLNNMGDSEVKYRQKLIKYNDQMNLVEIETRKYHDRFDKYGLSSENEKRSAILCQRAESEMFLGNLDTAEMLYKQAREVDPVSAYPLIMSASYELNRNRMSNAINFIEQATKKLNAKTGGLCYTVKARIHYALHDGLKEMQSYEKILHYETENDVVRHKYGVLLSKNGQVDKAIEQFDYIINKHKNYSPPTSQLLFALKTRIINAKRINNTELVEKDKKWVQEIFTKYPHLAAEAHQFSDIL